MDLGVLVPYLKFFDNFGVNSDFVVIKCVLDFSDTSMTHPNQVHSPYLKFDCKIVIKDLSIDF